MNGIADVKEVVNQAISFDVGHSDSVIMLIFEEEKGKGCKFNEL